MSFAKNVAFVVLAASLTACGGAELEQAETPEPVTPPAGEQQPVDGTGDDGTVSAFWACTAGGSEYCLAECNDGINHWYNVGHYTVIAWGDCRSAAYNYCVSQGYPTGHNGACWGG